MIFIRRISGFYVCILFFLLHMIILCICIPFQCVVVLWWCVVVLYLCVSFFFCTFVYCFLATLGIHVCIFLGGGGYGLPAALYKRDFCLCCSSPSVYGQVCSTLWCLLPVWWIVVWSLSFSPTGVISSFVLVDV